MAKKISELRKRMSPESRARAEAKAKVMLAEMPLDKVTEPHEQEKWLSENREALKAYNDHVESDDVFSNGLRTF